MLEITMSLFVVFIMLVFGKNTKAKKSKKYLLKAKNMALPGEKMHKIYFKMGKK